jgi:hypothetical protein
MSFFKTIYNLLINNSSSNNIALNYIETCELDRGFSNYFQENLQDQFKAIEDLRLTTFKKVRYRLIAAFIIFIVITLLLYSTIYTSFKYGNTSPLGIGNLTSNMIHFLDLMGYLIFTISALLYWTFIPGLEFNRNLKLTIIPHIVNFIPNCKTKNESYIDKDYVFDSAIFPSLLRLFGKINFLESKHRNKFTFITDDNIAGSYKDTSYNLSELEIKKQYSDRYNLNIFKGYLITIECKKNFKQKTVITYSSNILFNFFYRMKYKFNGLSSVKLEDLEFNRIFKVYSNDQIESRFLLTPTFMDRLYKLALLYKKHNNQSNNLFLVLLGEFFKLPVELLSRVFPNLASRLQPIPMANRASLIQASFYNQEIIIAAPSINGLFEFKVLDKPVSSKTISTIFQEIKIVYDIIDDLKLHHDLGL